MRLALLSSLPPDPSRLADYAAQFRRALNLADIDVLTPLVGQRPLDNLAAAQAWVAERDWRGVDVVHAELAPGRRSEYWVLCALARLRQRPALSVTVHEPPGLLWQPVHWPWLGLSRAPWLPAAARRASAWLASPLTRWADRRLARRLDGLVAHTEAGAARLIRRLKLPAERVTVIPYGLPEGRRVPTPPNAALKVLCLSGAGQRLRPLEDLLAALVSLQAQAPECATQLRLTLAGPTAASCFPPPRHDPLPALRASSAARQLEGLIDWQLDPDLQDIPALVASHDLVLVHDVSPPQAEDDAGGQASHRMALAMAMAAARPLLVSQTGELPEAVAQGNGASYPLGNKEALATLLADLIRERAQMAPWRAQAQALADQRAWPQLAPRYVSFYQQTMAHVAATQRGHVR